jgi:hypothetical protein
VDSWLFLFISGILIFGVGLENNMASCSTAIYLCIGCYGTSKLFIYLFLIERVYVVWAPASGGRLKSPIYNFCLITVALFGVIAALLIWGQIHYFRPDGACKIGLRKLASRSLLCYDLFINVLLTTLFLWPLFRSKFLSRRIKRVATRTLLAAAAALTTSTVNITVLTILHGEQLGWVCLGSCGTDVLFNAFAIYWVTGGTAAAVRPTTVDTELTDNTDSNRKSRKSVLSASPSHISIPNPAQALHHGSYEERTSTENSGVDAQGDPNGKGIKPFFKSIWSTLWNKKVEDEGMASGVIEISVKTTTDYEMDPIPRNVTRPRTLAKTT